MPSLSTRTTCSERLRLPPQTKPTVVLPARAEEVLSKGDGVLVGKHEHTTYRSGVGKILHMMKWSRNDILNRARELSRFMSNPTDVHLDRLYRLMNYVTQSTDYGNYIQPNIIWDGVDQSFLFTIYGRSDSEDASNPDERRSVSGGTVLLNGAVIHAFSRMQSCHSG
jgi:hypothetical protein